MQSTLTVMNDGAMLWSL